MGYNTQVGDYMLCSVIPLPSLYKNSCQGDKLSNVTI